MSKFIIREAVLGDVKVFLPLVKAFYEEADVEEITGAEFNDDDTECLLESLVESDLGFAYVVYDGDTPVAFLAGVISPSLFNMDRHSAKELGWWVRPEYRHSTSAGPRLLMYTKDALKALGITRLEMMHFTSTPKVGDFYKKLGLEEVERVYYWRL